MNLIVCDSDSKKALLSINGKKVKLKVNRTWSPETRQKVVKRGSGIAEQVISRKVGYAVTAELNPDSMNNPVVLKSNNKTSPKEIRVV